MAIKDLLPPAPPPPTTASERPPGITCETYTRGEGKRCVHYANNGACLHETGFMCVEWLKVNGHKPSLPAVDEPPKPAPVPRDLFGNPLPEVAAPISTPTTPPVAIAPKSDAEASIIDVDQLRGFTTDDIESFKARGLEVLLCSETYGDIWLVPAYTGQPRKEITPEHAATLARVMSVFAGSHIVSFHQTKNPSPPLSAQSAPSRSAHEKPASQLQPPLEV